MTDMGRSGSQRGYQRATDPYVGYTQGYKDGRSLGVRDRIMIGVTGIVFLSNIASIGIRQTDRRP